jgi:Gas vesicle synthesis protein GvpL/GvpF
VYVYGVVSAGTMGALAVEGVAGRPVETIESDGLAAVVSQLAEERLRVRRRDLLAHLRVLETVFAETTVVPCAFGMVVPNRQAVATDFMSARLAELRALLDELDGRLQLNVTASYDEAAVLRELVATDPEIARGREQTLALGRAGHFANIRLGELVAAALADRRAADNGRLLERLAAASEDVAVDSADDMTVLKASFLIARERAERFDSVLEELAAAEGPRIMFEAIGPLPPTAFAELGAGG